MAVQSARRTEIAEALLSVMAERGYDGATIAQIAAAAGIRPGLVHYHFTDKREILRAAIELLAGRHRARLDAALEASAPEPPARLRAFIEAHLALDEGAQSSALAAWIWMSAEALRDEDTRKAVEAVWVELEARLRTLIEEGVEHGWFGTVDADAAPAALLAAVQGYFVLSATAPALVPRGSAVRSVLTMTRGLLGLEVEP